MATKSEGSNFIPVVLMLTFFVQMSYFYDPLPILTQYSYSYR